MNSETPYTSVSIATDFSACSAVAVRQGIRVARATGAAARVIHVIDTSVAIELERALSREQADIRSALTRDAAQAWESFARGVDGAAELELDVAINNRVAGIITRCREAKSDLLVLGAFGDRRPSVGAGTVATGCVRAAVCDVLLVRDDHPGPFTRIIAAVDFSETSVWALSRAAALAAIDDAELYVLHAFRPPWEQLHYKAPTLLTAEHLQKQYRDALEGRLAAVVRDVTKRYPSLQARTVLFPGHGHRSAIAAYAESASADLVVLGTRGARSIRDTLLGSTAEKTLAEARCSVLAVKPTGRRR